MQNSLITLKPEAQKIQLHTSELGPGAVLLVIWKNNERNYKDRSFLKHVLVSNDTLANFTRKVRVHCNMQLSSIKNKWTSNFDIVWKTIACHFFHSSVSIMNNFGIRKPRIKRLIVNRVRYNCKFVIIYSYSLLR